MVTCKRCGSAKIVKSGMVRGKQRYLCKQCGFYFVEGDAREKDTAILPKALCTVFRALGVNAQYRTIGDFLWKRDPAQICRWIHGTPGKYKREKERAGDLFFEKDRLLKRIYSGIGKDENPALLVENVVDDTYIAVVMQRRRKG